MKMLPLIVAILILSVSGCAHDPAGAPADGGLSAPEVLAEAQQPSASDQPASNEDGQASASDNAADSRSASEDELDSLLDEEMDFLGDEDLAANMPVPDPLYHWNRAMFHLNDGLYTNVLDPAARGYKRAVHKDLRMMFRNFFHNLGFPVRFVASLLQGKGREAGSEMGGFLINSTLGVCGFGTPAQDVWGIGKNDEEEDLGQTLGVWGFGEGFYLVWPLLGPSTLRDTVGTVGDSYLDPRMYLLSDELSLGSRAFEIINETSFRLGDYESMKDFALDPYVSMRNFYIQHRRKAVAE